MGRKQALWASVRNGWKAAIRNLILAKWEAVATWSSGSGGGHNGVIVSYLVETRSMVALAHTDDHALPASSAGS